jgi:hypothetical protein
LESEGCEEGSIKPKISMPRERDMIFSNPLKTKKSKCGEKNF